MAEYTRVKTTFEPIYDKNSRVLILGTFPSVKSREENFYYGHPQNRFWRLIANLTGEEVPTTIEEKKALLLQHKIALWDVGLECEIIGSSDSSIRNVVPADINRILRSAKIEKIIGNGEKACKLYEKYRITNKNITVIIVCTKFLPLNFDATNVINVPSIDATNIGIIGNTSNPTKETI